MDYIALSKEISYALRHAPHEYGLILDDQGWISVDQLISALNGHGRFACVEDIEKMIQISEKKRHEICDGKIRALYGHSVDKKIIKEPMKPPDILYHGTAHRFIEKL